MSNKRIPKIPSPDSKVPNGGILFMSEKTETSFRFFLKDFKNNTRQKIIVQKRRSEQLKKQFLERYAKTCFETVSGDLDIFGQDDIACLRLVEELNVSDGKFSAYEQALAVFRDGFTDEMLQGQIPKQSYGNWPPSQERTLELTLRKTMNSKIYLKFFNYVFFVPHLLQKKWNRQSEITTTNNFLDIARTIVGERRKLSYNYWFFVIMEPDRLWLRLKNETITKEEVALGYLQFRTKTSYLEGEREAFAEIISMFI